MKINPGEVITVTGTSTNPADPPLNVQWKPQPGKTQYTITLTSPEGDTEQHTFTVNAKVGA